jgi:hypothetical protein
MREQTYGWNLEMQMRAARAGLRILVSGRLQLPQRRQFEVGGKLVRDHSGWSPHHRDLRANCERARSASGQRAGGIDRGSSNVP